MHYSNILLLRRRFGSIEDAVLSVSVVNEDGENVTNE
jgi:hypothetical protein